MFSLSQTDETIVVNIEEVDVIIDTEELDVLEHSCGSAATPPRLPPHAGLYAAQHRFWRSRSPSYFVHIK
jgi:hypothetical protein